MDGRVRVEDQVGAKVDFGPMPAERWPVTLLSLSDMSTSAH